MNDLKNTDKITCLTQGSPVYSVKLRDDVIAKRSERGRVSLFRKEVKFLDIPENLLIECLIDNWMTETSIDCLAESADNRPAVYFLCEKLFSLGLLQAKCMVDGKSLFSLLPAPDWSVWQRSLPTGLGGLSPNACLRRIGSNFVLEMPLSQRKCIIHEGVCLTWLMALVQGDASLTVGDKGRMVFYRALWLMGALEKDEPVQNLWGFHDLLFFHHSSIGFHDDLIGATSRRKDRFPVPPLFKPCTGECISLPEPGENLVKKLHTPFADVVARRRTGRIPGVRPITIEELGALLHVSARVQNIYDDPCIQSQVSRRPSPSGGALHSLEIYLLVRECSGLVPGVWRYDPAHHQLESVTANNALLNAYLKNNPHAMIKGAGPPHIRLVVTSRILRDLWKYENIAYRLVLQDLGCLYQTLSLSATALNLVACILGAVDARYIGEMLKIETLLEPVIGEMTLSSPC